MAIIDISDALHRALNRGRYAYVISFDIEGAFDTAAHRRLMASLRRSNVDPYLRRFLHGWLRDRTFQLKTRESEGIRYSSIRPITRGLPQGGVISPLMRNLFFNEVADALKLKRGE